MKIKVEMIVDIEDFDSLQDLSADMVDFIEAEYDCEIEILTASELKDE